MELLLRLLRDRDFNLTTFKQPALTGGHRSKDEGLYNLVQEGTPEFKQQLPKDAMIEFLEKGGQPNRETEKSDPTLTWHVFRIPVEGVDLFIKTRIIESDPKKIPRLNILNVKLKN